MALATGNFSECTHGFGLKWQWVQGSTAVYITDIMGVTTPCGFVHIENCGVDLVASKHSLTANKKKMHLTSY